MLVLYRLAGDFCGQCANALDRGMSASLDNDDNSYDCSHSRPFAIFTSTRNSFKLQRSKQPRRAQIESSMFRIRGRYQIRRDKSEYYTSTITQQKGGGSPEVMRSQQHSRVRVYLFCPASTNDCGCFPNMETL